MFFNACALDFVTQGKFDWLIDGYNNKICQGKIACDFTVIYLSMPAFGLNKHRKLEKIKERK